MKKTATKDHAKQWESSRKTYAIREVGALLPDGLGALSPLVRTLLQSRNVTVQADADVFLKPGYEEHMHDPFLLPGMKEAVERILDAIDRKERIAIWSDYDADGIPGAVVLHDFFKKIGHEDFENYIPHRHDEGFGLNIEGVERLAENGAKLVITIDCGITDTKEVDRANELGMDVIITDHHLPSRAGLPKAVAIVDPKLEGSTYPFADLCGAGVAFKLVQALLKTRDFGIVPGWEKWLLDMVGLATLSDMVPLRGENRVIAFYGLKVMRRTPRPGVLKLARRLGLDLRTMTEDDIAFTITPRINAASRMGVPMDAFMLLSATDEVEADRLALHLDEINNERKGVVASIAREAKKYIAERGGTMKPVLVMGNPDWRPSLLGLVANTLAEEYKRPVFLWGRDNGNGLKGSCRSDGVTDLVALMEGAKEVFLDFGGHKMSGGFSLAVESAHLLEDSLVSACTERGADETSAEPIDGILGLEDVNAETYSSIEKLAPYGFGNPKPVFVFENVVIDSVRQFGKGNLHLEVSFSNAAGKRVKAISFFTQPDRFGLDLAPGQTVSLIATIEKSTFRGFTELRLRIVDIC